MICLSSFVWHLSCLVLCASGICGVVSDINLGKIFSHYHFKYFFFSSFLSSLSGLPTTHMLYLFVVVPQSLDILFCFVLFLSILLIYPLAERFFSSAVSSLLISALKALFYVSQDFYLKIFSLRIYISVYIAICSCILFTYPL